MSVYEQRYPENTSVDLDSFRRSDWKSAIDCGDGDVYPGLWKSLAMAAGAAVDSGNASNGKVLWLLADACSMILNPGSINEPFGPYMRMPGMCTSLPEDFHREDILLLSQLVEDIDDVWLRARIADLVWLLLTPRNQRFALMAIDAYVAIPLDAETWLRGGRECWARAIRLSLMLGPGAGARLKQLEAKLVSAFDLATSDDGLLALWLSDLALNNHLCPDIRRRIADHLETLAKHFDCTGQTSRSRQYCDASVRWFKTDGNEAKVTEMTVLAAESYVKEAGSGLASKQPSNMIAAILYENAIQKYRTIPKSRRAEYHVDERILELRSSLAAAGQSSLGEMAAISSPTIDITGLVEAARDAVSGKSPLDALAAFANIYGGAHVAGIRRQAEKTLQAHPLLALLPQSRMSRDGRVIAKRPGMSLEETPSQDNSVVLWAQMVNAYCMELELTVAGRIWPALGRLQLEHRLPKADFVDLCYHSPITPQGREQIVGQGLFAGYEKDFVGALHLLVPQLEHIVRDRLKAEGAKTTILDSNGIENESGLGTLMELPEATKVFGEDLAFELKALFCDAFGPNLRNAVAHGLLDYDECASAHSVYAWWLCLRLVFNTFWTLGRSVGTTADTYAI